MSVNEQHRNALPPGYRLESFRMGSVLGHGGFGITYRALDEDLRHAVAIKEYLPREVAFRDRDSTVLPLSESDRETFDWGLERFLDEARTLARFRHPNIVGVRRFIRANGTAYLVMDYCDGESLETLLEREGTLSEEQLQALLVPLLDALETLHDAGVTHRDIKPGNIYLRDDGSPVLLDFGAARQALAHHSRSVTAMATPGYAAFEQYSTKGKQGPWTDIYGLGATLYRCVTGQRPPDASDRMLEDDLVPAADEAAGRYRHSLLSKIDAALEMRPAARPENIREWGIGGTVASRRNEGFSESSSERIPGWGSLPTPHADHELAGSASETKEFGNPEATGSAYSNSNGTGSNDPARPTSSKPVFENIFTFSGRRNRKSYILFHLALVVIAPIFFTVVAVFEGMGISDEALGVFIALGGLALVPMLIVSIAVGTQRLRDLGYSGWWIIGLVLFGLVPYIGWIGYLLLVFLPGERGSNQYGPDPLKSSRSE